MSGGTTALAHFDDPAPWLRVGLSVLLLVKGAGMGLAGVAEFRRARRWV